MKMKKNKTLKKDMEVTPATGKVIYKKENNQMKMKKIMKKVAIQTNKINLQRLIPIQY